MAAEATTYTFKGFGFDPTAAHDTVVFNDGAVGTVATANSTAMTVRFSTDPTMAGNLTAIVTIDDEDIGGGGAGGDRDAGGEAAHHRQPASQRVADRDQRPASIPRRPITRWPLTTVPVALVPTASPTSLTVTFSTKPKTAGNLTAVVTTDNAGVAENSGNPVQVVTVTPVVTSSTADLAASATQITISGFGFDPTTANNEVIFDDSAVGTITAATATSLTVTFTTKPTNAGSLTVVVTTDDESSGNPVQVATVT